MAKYLIPVVFEIEAASFEVAQSNVSDWCDWPLCSRDLPFGSTRTRYVPEDETDNFGQRVIYLHPENADADWSGPSDEDERPCLDDKLEYGHD